MFKDNNVRKSKKSQNIKEWTNSKIPFIKERPVLKACNAVKKRIGCTQCNFVMNERNWFAFAKAFEKLNLTVDDAITLNNSSSAVVLDMINEISMDKV